MCGSRAAATERPDLFTESLWLDLVTRRQVTRPTDVLPHYRRLVEAHIAAFRDKQRHRRAVALLPRMPGAVTAPGRGRRLPALSPGPARQHLDPAHLHRTR